MKPRKFSEAWCPPESTFAVFIATFALVLFSWGEGGEGNQVMVTRRVELQHHLTTRCCNVEIPETVFWGW